MAVTVLFASFEPLLNIATPPANGPLRELVRWWKGIIFAIHPGLECFSVVDNAKGFQVGEPEHFERINLNGSHD